ncbi:MAG: hypothetical protein KKE86_12450 [Planctomycetes bacterium]|nr:hypothetical protein [Planctomycetota bacterium]MBU4400131.1 hypothetical protein [Planctomycetota bacterium]MCG2685564.1 hypothetical protein [Planctomycetales bacterium]
MTLYQIADAEIRLCIESYLRLTKATKGLSFIKPADLGDERARTILLAGLGVWNPSADATEACEEWKRRQAIAFDLEAAVTFGVYRNIRKCSAEFLDSVERATDGFTRFESGFIRTNPHFLPILQHLGGIFSKSALKKHVGSVSDNSISKPASERLAQLLSERVDPKQVNKGEILQRVETTLEGIVRDLVGRVLLESMVDSALRDRGVAFQREEEYSSLAGVVYDFRADFVLPNAQQPKAFIEVRKSSSRHASLYAKDKMFSAINWKGKTTGLLGILVVDGEWTGETLRVMAKVFDYVVPIGRVTELADTVKSFLDGDKSKLKWLIEFRITPAS